MTAQHVPTDTANDNHELIGWAKNEIHKELELVSKSSRKRNWHNTIDENEESMSPPEKTIRLDKVDMSKETLLAYKRIWNNLDMSKPTDAKLEPFIWSKIRQLQNK